MNESHKSREVPVKVDVLNEAFRFVVIFGVAIFVYALLFPALKNFGLPDPQRQSEMSDFVRNLGSSRSNNAFLYVAGVLTWMTSFLLCTILIFPQMERFKLLSPGQGRRAKILFLGTSLIALFTFCWRGQVFIGLAETTGRLFQGPYLAFVVVAWVLMVLEERWPRFIRKGFDVLVVALIAALTLRNDVHYFDFSNFICAVTDVSLGKDITVDVISQYGFLNIYFLAGIFKLFGVKDVYAALSVVNSIFYVLGFSYLYFLFRRYTDRLVFSALAVFCVLFINFYLLMHIPAHWVPSIGFIRFGAIFPVLFLLLDQRLKERIHGHGWVLGLVLALSVFWTIEVGVYIFMAFLALAFLKILLVPGALRERCDLLAVLAKSGVVLMAFVIAFSFGIYLKYGHGPRWDYLVYYQSNYVAAGLGTQPLKDFYWWPLVVSIYFVTIYACLRFYEHIKNANAWIFLGFFGLQNLLYYIVLVIPDHLARASLPASILVFMAMGVLIRRPKSEQALDRRRILARKFVYLGCAVFAGVGLANMPYSAGCRNFVDEVVWGATNFLKNQRSDALAKFMPQDKREQFLYDIDVIQRLTGADEHLVVISKHDTAYHSYAQRKAFLNISFYPNFGYISRQVSEAVRDIINSQTRYVFMDATDYQCYPNIVSGHLEEFRNGLAQSFRRVERLGLLDLYERRTP